MARRHMAHLETGTVDQAPEVFRVPASHYTDPERWQLEIDRVFKRVPLVLAMGCEIKEPGDYKAIEAAGTPVLITRGTDGKARAFLNACRHRGTPLVAAGTSGSTRHFVCPYHAWTYDPQGQLVRITDNPRFGDVDKSCLGLRSLPTAERAGLVFVVLTPDAPLEIDAFLAGYDKVLEYFDFGNMHLIATNQVVGPNWKLAYDGYLDFYHLPILHKNSFGPQMSRDAFYDAWGPHQRVTGPEPRLLELKDKSDQEWDANLIAGGVWTIFPHVSYAGDPRGGMLSQLFPGPTPDRSITIQNHLVAKLPDEAGMKKALKNVEFLKHVVEDEDYFTGLQIQTVLETGEIPEVLFGRNESGGQRFHQWLDRLIDAADPGAALALFKDG